MAGHFLHSGRIGCVVVGADRIAANGDVANKIGTYSVAVLAKENGVPFYVAAPVSTLDLTLASGDQIPIEQRSADEVTHVFGSAGCAGSYPGGESGVRRDAGALRDRDRHRARRGPRALRRIAAQVGADAGSMIYSGLLLSFIDSPCIAAPFLPPLVPLSAQGLQSAGAPPFFASRFRVRQHHILDYRGPWLSLDFTVTNPRSARRFPKSRQ